MLYVSYIVGSRVVSVDRCQRCGGQSRCPNFPHYDVTWIILLLPIVLVILLTKSLLIYVIPSSEFSITRSSTFTYKWVIQNIVW